MAETESLATTPSLSTARGLPVPRPNQKNKSQEFIAFSADWIHNVSIRIVTESFLKRMSGQYPHAAEWLVTFHKSCKTAKWQNIVDLRRVYPHADLVKVKSGRSVIVLNVAGNKYRMLIAIHFDRQTVFALRFMTHAEYSKDLWKNEL